MIGEGPYRAPPSPPWGEEDLWHLLDDALLESLRNPGIAVTIATWVIQDAQKMQLSEVAEAAQLLIDAILEDPSKPS